MLGLRAGGSPSSRDPSPRGQRRLVLPGSGGPPLVVQQPGVPQPGLPPRDVAQPILPPAHGSAVAPSQSQGLPTSSVPTAAPSPAPATPTPPPGPEAAAAVARAAASAAVSATSAQQAKQGVQQQLLLQQHQQPAANAFADTGGSGSCGAMPPVSQADLRQSASVASSMREYDGLADSEPQSPVPVVSHVPGVQTAAATAAAAAASGATKAPGQLLPGLAPLPSSFAWPPLGSQPLLRAQAAAASNGGSGASNAALAASHAGVPPPAAPSGGGSSGAPAPHPAAPLAGAPPSVAAGGLGHRATPVQPPPPAPATPPTSASPLFQRKSTTGVARLRTPSPSQRPLAYLRMPSAPPSVPGQQQQPLQGMGSPGGPCSAHCGAAPACAMAGMAGAAPGAATKTSPATSPALKPGMRMAASTPQRSPRVAGEKPEIPPQQRSPSPPSRLPAAAAAMNGGSPTLWQWVPGGTAAAPTPCKPHPAPTPHLSQAMLSQKALQGQQAMLSQKALMGQQAGTSPRANAAAAAVVAAAAAAERAAAAAGASTAGGVQHL